MNKNIDCEIIGDLLPLYCDGVVSKKTEAEIKKHLADCEKCTEEYKILSGELPADSNALSTQKRFIDTMKKQRKNNRRKIFIASALAFVIILSGAVIEHYYGDNIYGMFVFRESEVVKVDENTFKVSKDNPDAFIDYMEDTGWEFTDRLGSVFVFDSDESVANCQLEFKEFYALYTVDYLEKVKPSSELLSIYGKTLYSHSIWNGKITYSTDDNSESKRTWTVAWYQDKNTASMESATLVIENEGKKIFAKGLELNATANGNSIHGWNYYVLAPNSFSAKLNPPADPAAYIVFLDSNGIEYKVCLDPTDINEPEGTTADNSNKIIITDGNGSYSYYEYDDDLYYLPDN